MLTRMNSSTVVDPFLQSFNLTIKTQFTMQWTELTSAQNACFVLRSTVLRNGILHKKKEATPQYIVLGVPSII